MKVLFFGAGASYGAFEPSRYPLASQLLTEVERYAKEPIHGIEHAWNAFDDFRRRATGVAADILASTNPEIALSLVDLLVARRKDQGDFAMHQLWKSEVYDRDSVHERYEQLMTADPMLVDAELARNQCIGCIEQFFWSKHSEVFEMAIERGFHLPRLLSNLANGDVVITTNWDSLIERVVVESGYWMLGDGYGFPVKLALAGRPRPLEPFVVKPSAVTLLKLHGSVGWYSKAEGPIFLSSARFLQHLSFSDEDRSVSFVDLAEPETPGGTFSVEWASIYPTYLKRLANPTMLQIWRRAADALAQAEKVVVVGYSLPASDVAIRLLLSPLRQRLDEEQVDVVVHDPCDSVQCRWKNFLGDRTRVTSCKVRDLGPL